MGGWDECRGRPPHHTHTHHQKRTATTLLLLLIAMLTAALAAAALLVGLDAHAGPHLPPLAVAPTARAGGGGLAGFVVVAARLARHWAVRGLGGMAGWLLFGRRPRNLGVCGLLLWVPGRACVSGWVVGVGCNGFIMEWKASTLRFGEGKTQLKPQIVLYSLCPTRLGQGHPSPLSSPTHAARSSLFPPPCHASTGDSDAVDQALRTAQGKASVGRRRVNVRPKQAAAQYHGQAITSRAVHRHGRHEQRRPPDHLAGPACPPGGH